jgi:hypothetical protein
MRSGVTLVLTIAVQAATAQADSITVTVDGCAPLAEHFPSADVAFEPGVDAIGQPVADADLYDGRALVVDLDDLSIPVEVPIVRTFGVVGDGQLFVARGGKVSDFDATVEVGEVTARNGAVYFDGVRLSGPDFAAYAPACRSAR